MMKLQSPKPKLQRRFKFRPPVVFVWFAVVSAIAALASGTGCVTKAKAKEQAREAFFAGQQQAMAKLMQSHSGPSISIIGPVRSPSIAFTEGLTVAKAILQAGYEPPGEPRQIVILRNGFAIPVDPHQLLSGQDVPLQNGDLLQITP
jgi:hypothetical protein